MYRNQHHEKITLPQHEQFQTQPDKEHYSSSLWSSPLSIIISYIDKDQKYTFIKKPYPDYLPDNAIGKRDDEVNLSPGAQHLSKLKKRVITNGVGVNTIIPFQLLNGTRYYSISIEPLYDDDGDISGAVCASLDITSHIQIEKEQKEIIDKLKYALAELNTLSGIISMCSYCNDIKNENGGWDHIDKYISQHTEAKVSHGICPACMAEHYPDFINIFNEI